MSIQRPSKPEEIRDAIAHGRPFYGPKIEGRSIAVLSGRQNVTGPLAGMVNESAADYEEQYTTGGGRNHPAWHVVYYVTTADPDAPGSRYVIAYVTAEGETQIRAHRALPKPLMAAVSEGIRAMDAAREWLNIATDRGDYPVQDDDYAGTFTLWGRDTRNPIQETRALAHFTDRHAAREAVREYERGGEPYTSPTGYRGTRNHAWVTREAAPIGAYCGEV